MIYGIGESMSLRNNLVKRQLKAMGIDLSDPKKLTFKTIRSLISTSVPSLINKEQMIRFLEDQVIELKK